MQRHKYNWPLAEGIKARLSDSGFGRQRVIAEQEQLLLILHEPPKPDEKLRVESVFLREQDGSWWHNGQRKGEHGLVLLLEEYRKALDQYDQMYEAANSADELFLVIEQLNPLLRAVKNADMALQSAREAVTQDRFILHMRDEFNEILRHYELLGEETKLALDYRIAKNAESQINEARNMAHAQHKLNRLAALTFPMMALSSLFGMNLHSGLEDTNSWLFWLVMGFGMGAGAVVLGWVNKNKK